MALNPPASGAEGARPASLSCGNAPPAETGGDTGGDPDAPGPPVGRSSDGGAHTGRASAGRRRAHGHGRGARRLPRYSSRFAWTPAAAAHGATGRGDPRRPPARRDAAPVHPGDGPAARGVPRGGGVGLRAAARPWLRRGTAPLGHVRHGRALTVSPEHPLAARPAGRGGLHSPSRRARRLPAGRLEVRLAPGQLPAAERRGGSAGVGRPPRGRRRAPAPDPRARCRGP